MSTHHKPFWICFDNHWLFMIIYCYACLWVFYFTFLCMPVCLWWCMRRIDRHWFLQGYNKIQTWYDNRFNDMWLYYQICQGNGMCRWNCWNCRSCTWWDVFDVSLWHDAPTHDALVQLHLYIHMWHVAFRLHVNDVIRYCDHTKENHTTPTQRYCLNSQRTCDISDGHPRIVTKSLCIFFRVLNFGLVCWCVCVRVCEWHDSFFLHCYTC